MVRPTSCSPFALLKNIRIRNKEKKIEKRALIALAASQPVGKKRITERIEMKRARKNGIVHQRYAHDLPYWDFREV